MFDQQLYDTTPASEKDGERRGFEAALLSNTGLGIYREVDDVIILQQCHRLRLLKEATTQQECESNERAQRFLDILHRFRDVEWTLADYHWLCRRKKSFLSLEERARFLDAPVIMDFRRSTEDNPEDNCQYYNKVQLRKMAREKTFPSFAGRPSMRVPVKRKVRKSTLSSSTDSSTKSNVQWEREFSSSTIWRWNMAS